MKATSIAGILGWSRHSTAPGRHRQRLPEMAKDLTGDGFGVKFGKTRRQGRSDRRSPPMHRSRAADDFTTIRQRLEELRREREGLMAAPEGEADKRGTG